MKRAFQFLQQLRGTGVSTLKSDATGPLVKPPPTLSIGERLSTAARASVTPFQEGLGLGMTYLKSGWTATQSTLHSNKERIASGISYGANKLIEAPQAYARDRIRKLLFLGVGVSCAVFFFYGLGSALPDAILRYSERQKKEQQKS
jgi:hypothetical protein